MAEVRNDTIILLIPHRNCSSSRQTKSLAVRKALVVPPQALLA
jgi:hypothetical protein